MRCLISSAAIPLRRDGSGRKTGIPMESDQATLFGTPDLLAAPRSRRTRRVPSLREAMAPYIDVDDLRRLIADGQTTRLHTALRCQDAPPAIYDLLRLLADLLRPAERTPIRNPADAAALLMVEMGHLDHEELWVICLDCKNQVQRIVTLYVGTVNAAQVRVAEVFKEAIRLNSAAILIAHCHPSGIPDPSPEDILLTRQIVEAGHLLDITTTDHLIIGQGRWISLRQKGLGFGE